MFLDSKTELHAKWMSDRKVILDEKTQKYDAKVAKQKLTKETKVANENSGTDDDDGADIDVMEEHK